MTSSVSSAAQRAPLPIYPVQGVTARKPVGDFAAQLSSAQSAAESKPTQPPKPVEAEAPVSKPIKIARAWNMESAEETTRVQEDPDFSFDDFLDFINPLHHIPIVGTIYRELSGDTIKSSVQVAGDMAYGIATGNVLLSAAMGIASAAIEQQSGSEPLVQVADAVFGSDTAEESSVIQVAQADPEADAMADAPAPVAAPVAEVKVADATATVEEQAVQTISAGTAPSPASAPQPPHTPHPVQPRQVASVEGTRMGNIIYTSPLMQSAAKVAKVQPVTTTESPQASAASTLTETAKVTASDKAATATLDSPTLGALIQEQAKATAAGNKLPPELVHDMMLMAYDKYKTAHLSNNADAIRPE